MPYLPDFDEFAERAKSSGLVRVSRRVANDCLVPVSAFYNLDQGSDRKAASRRPPKSGRRGLSDSAYARPASRGSNAFLLESVEGADKVAQYSLLGTDPFLRFEAYGEKVTVTPGVLPPHPDWNADGSYVGKGDPLDALQSVLDVYRAEPAPGLAGFSGGAVGYLGYDTIRYTEHLPDAPFDDRCLPDIAFDFYGSVVAFDHTAKTVTVTANARIPSPSAPERRGEDGEDLRGIYRRACQQVDDLVARLHRAADMPVYDIHPNPSRLIYRGFDKSTFEANDFCNAVRRCKEYIVAGDIFQVVISQRLETRTSADPFDVYRALRIINPSPYMFFIRMGRNALVGSSPEIMVRVEDGEVTIRPLAGTRPRGATDAEDAQLGADLLDDEKEKAEHVMLVDLARNDVGRVARLGSVRLKDVMAIERYSHVMHLSSTVTGRLAEGKTPLDAIRSGLPAGTVSGAPKVRAMEIIDEIEPRRRGPYAGGVGFIDFSGNIETCLALRTLVCKARKVYIQAGAGIVADSDPQREYQETINKAKGLLKAIQTAEEWRHPMSSELPDVLSLIQPTAGLHIGNYFGAVANWVALQDTHTCIYGVADLHAMTMPYDPAQLRANTENMVLDLLACGIDPAKSVLFVQSLVPEHTELTWILSCQCSFGELGRMTQFKDKSELLQKDSSDEFVSAGLFTYPVLQVADILAYRAKYVPVGKDQEQHLELSRSVARRFNQRHQTAFFPEPQPLFTHTPRIMSLARPDAKMSKSAGERHYVGLFEEEESIRKKVSSAVTDTGQLPPGTYMSPGVENLFEILRACGKTDAANELEDQYKAKGLKYVHLKKAVADALVELTGRLRARRQEIARDPDAVQANIVEMSAKAREIAGETLRGVRELVGLPRIDS